MAKRLLIALLALMGLAAQIAPAQARVSAGPASAVGTVLPAAHDERASALPASLAVRPASPRRMATGPATALAVYAAPTAVPVHTGIDRARE